jgi:hypothetical protein
MRGQGPETRDKLKHSWDPPVIVTWLLFGLIVDFEDKTG